AMPFAVPATGSGGGEGAARHTRVRLPVEADPNYIRLCSLASGVTGGSGLQYRCSRYYGRETGRFARRSDRARGGNESVRVRGDPVNHRDPFGLNPCLVPPVAQGCIASAIAAGSVLAWVTGKLLQRTLENIPL